MVTKLPRYYFSTTPLTSMSRSLNKMACIDFENDNKISKVDLNTCKLVEMSCLKKSLNSSFVYQEQYRIAKLFLEVLHFYPGCIPFWFLNNHLLHFALII